MTEIANIRTILTAPDGIALVVVRVDTDQDGLYGLGCATFTQRPTLVAAAVDDYLAPLLAGRDPANIEDMWHLMHVNAYWRNGPVLNSAISGVDMALWDIKGKVAGLPVYDLLGGKCRAAALVYRHADGRDPAEVLDQVVQFREDGHLAVRCQMGGYGGRTGEAEDGTSRLRASFKGSYYDPDRYARSVVGLFDHIRAECRRRPVPPSRRPRTARPHRFHPSGSGVGAAPPVFPGGSIPTRPARLVCPAAPTDRHSDRHG